MDAAQVEALLGDLEDERVERKESLADKDKVCQAICAYANDLPNSGLPGHVVIGARDDGSLAGLDISDRLLRTLADLRSDGRILPTPTMSVERVALGAEAVAVVTVEPSMSPPVRFAGVTWIRVGPQRAIASAEEERRLTEKRISGSLPFDQRGITNAPLSELDYSYFEQEYLPQAISRDSLAQNRRSMEDRLASLRFVTADLSHPTNAGVLALSIDPRMWIPGAYVDFARFAGSDRTAPIKVQHEISGRLGDQARIALDVLASQIQTGAVIEADMRRRDLPDYPLEALRELLYNALMHRAYEGTAAPVRVYWFDDHIEVQNPGGLYGVVTAENYDRITDYRNPVVAEAMRTLGYVERFGTGVGRVKRLLAENGNPPAEFDFEPEFVQVTVRRAE